MQLYRVIFATIVMLALGAHTAVAQVSCLPIERIDVRGTSLLSAAEVSAAIAPYEGRCLGIPQINAALEAITFSYVDKGYITTRAYLPEQNLADRVLDIRVVEGKLSAIRFNGEPRKLWQAIVFPDMIGRTANLREIEQGLERIRAMPSYSAEMEVSAGAAEGESILDVTAQAEKRWSARLGASNHGSPNSGTYLSTLDLSYDHLLGMNESWALNLSRGVSTFPFSFEEGPEANYSIGTTARFPYGPWLLKATYKYSAYNTDHLGPITTIGTDGWTHSADLTLSRVITRGQDSKTTLSAQLARRDVVNRIAEITILASSRVITTTRIDLEHERTVLGGKFTARVGVERGLDFLGAEVFSEQPDGQPNAQFTLVDFGLKYQHTWETGIGNIGYNGAIKGQWGFDKLYGAQQFALGGISTLRGAKGSVVAGNSGVLWRNELSWSPNITLPTTFGKIQLYGALDLGYIHRDVDLGIAGGGALGSAVGVRTIGGMISADIAWHQVLLVPNGVSAPDGILLLSVSARY